MLKKILKTSLFILLAVIFVVFAYLAYVIFSYNRIPDNQLLEVEKNSTEVLKTEETLSAITYNIGFGAYSADYSFFMDGGEHSRAYSEAAVIENTNGALLAIKQENPDFILLQEVDIDGTRSYHVNQRDIFAEGFSDMDNAFAVNYNSAYFLYPFNEPIGANKSGIFTLSDYEISSSLRRSLPIEDSFYKYLDLDRAYTISRIKTENGRELVLFNVHLSAYTSDGTISADQLKMLSVDMQSEYEKGNYVVAAGDFNKDLLGDSSKYFERSEGEFNWAVPFETELLPKGFSVSTGSNYPTCRNADSAFRGDGTDFVLSVDGFLSSDNVKIISCQTVNTAFAFSDHNPVKVEFILLD